MTFICELYLKARLADLDKKCFYKRIRDDKKILRAYFVITIILISINLEVR